MTQNQSTDAPLLDGSRPGEGVQAPVPAAAGVTHDAPARDLPDADDLAQRDGAGDAVTILPVETDDAAETADARRRTAWDEDTAR